MNLLLSRTYLEKREGKPLRVPIQLVPLFFKPSTLAFYPYMEDRSRAIIECILLELSNAYCSNYRMNIARTIEWILLELSHEYQVNLSNFATSLSNILKTWHRILTHFGNHRCYPCMHNLFFNYRSGVSWRRNKRLVLRTSNNVLEFFRYHR